MKRRNYRRGEEKLDHLEEGQNNQKLCTMYARQSVDELIIWGKCFCRVDEYTMHNAQVKYAEIHKGRSGPHYYWAANIVNNKKIVPMKSIKNNGI
jgi:hypothetical protein